MDAKRLVVVAGLLALSTALGGNYQCTPMEPVEPVCTWNGVGYEAGEEFPAGDGCNTCFCAEDGNVACTLMACGCEYGGAFYQYGEEFPAGDGCNTCICEEQGVACTEIACAECDPDEEYWRDYVADSPGTCIVIDFICPDNTSYFLNDCGCGCEMSQDCPEWIDCMPVQPADSLCNDPSFFARCPYTQIAW